MADGGDEPDEAEELGGRQKAEIAKWFLANAPAGEIQYVAKGATPLSSFSYIFPHLFSVVRRF